MTAYACRPGWAVCGRCDPTGEEDGGMEMTGDGAGCSRLIWLERGVCDSQCGGFVESSRCQHGKGVGRPELVGDWSFGLTVGLGPKASAAFA